MGERVVLLHGLGRQPRSMRRLGRGLAEAGFDPLPIGYPSRSHTIPELILHLRPRLQALGAGRIHFVGHSLGCILLRQLLAEPLPFTLGRFVMIAPPNRGAYVVTRLSRYTLLHRLFARPAIELGRDAPWLLRLPVPDCEIGVIAGTRSFHPMAPVSWVNTMLNPHAHDGTVELDSTSLPGMRDHRVIDANHTFICDHPETIRQTIAFLRDGRFAGPS
jgi:pimeloyl-ACP methyl ester carboxylesterase